MESIERRPNNQRALFLGLFIGSLIVDLVVKAFARAGLVEGQSTNTPWPGVFEITLKYNEGIAFGLFQGSGKWLAPVALAIAACAAWYHVRHPHEGPWAHATAALLSAGAIGNMVDRITLGRVTDMFWIRIIDFPVFNVADACISVAAVMLVISWIRDAARDSAKQATGTSETSAASSE